MKVARELDGLKFQVRPRLKDFLVEHGINVSENGMLKCIHPMHSDETASMRMLPDLNHEELYCYGCHAKGDIFTANHWLDAAPLTGLPFIKENLYVLANKYGIPYEEINFSPEQLEIIDTIRVNRVACEILSATDERGRPINWTNEYAVERGWGEEVCRRLKIGTIKDYNRFLVDVSRATGIDPSELTKEKYDLRSNLFGPEYITIPLFDEKGQPVGFISRYLKWKKASSKAKYINTHNGAAFTKGNLLYGLHLCRSARGRRLDLFEGNGSFITAFGAGHVSCAALCSSAITQEQIALIQRVGYKHVNICLDGDATGRSKTSKYMQALSGREGLKVTCTWLPKGKDPDDFIQEHGLAEFYKLGTQSAFSFFLEQEAESAKHGDLTAFISKMIRVIQNTENRVERGRQLKELAIAVEVPEEDIRAEMDRIQRVHVDAIKSELASGMRSAQDTDELLAILERGKHTITENAGARGEQVNLSVEESIENFENLITILSNRQPGIQGWRTGFQVLDFRLSGIPKPVGKDDNNKDIPIPGAILGFAGAPQHAKSTVLQNLSFNMACLNDDISVLFWSLDDSRELVLERLIAMDSGVDWTAVTRRRVPTDEEATKINSSIEKISKLISDGKFVLKDQTNGSALPMLTRWIEFMQKEFGRPICVVIDSFHKIGSSADERGITEFAKAKNHCEHLKTLYKTHNVTIMASLELNKSATRGIEPDMLQITESRKIEYDFDVVATVFNHYYDMDGQSDQIIMCGDSVKPIIKVNFRKSKSGGTGPIYFALDKTNFRLSAYTLDEVKRLTGTEEVKNIEVAGATIVPRDKGNLTSIGIKSVEEPWITT